MTKAGPAAVGEITAVISLAICLVISGITPAFAIDAPPPGFPADASGSANEPEPAAEPVPAVPADASGTANEPAPATEPAPARAPVPVKAPAPAKQPAPAIEPVPVKAAPTIEPAPVKQSLPAKSPAPANEARNAAPSNETASVAVNAAPGTTLTRDTVDAAKDLISPGVLWAVHNGMDMKIVPYQKIPIPSAYQKATEKYSGQVTLDEKNVVQNWVAGKPFPAVSNDDPKAAPKIMYDFLNTHYFTDDLNLHLVDADTGSLYLDSNNNRHYDVERHFVADWLRILPYTGRLHHDPMPSFPNNADEAFRKSGLYPLIEPFDLKGVGGISIRYLDSLRQDDTWLYLPSLRRVRRLSSAQRSDALFGQDIDVDSYGGYAGQIPWFEWKLLGEKPMLASLHGTRLPPEPCKLDGGMTFCEQWEQRPGVWIIEGKPKVANYAYSKRVIYVDKESNFIIYSDLYDQNEQLWKVVMQSIRTSTRPNPNVAYEYPEPRMFIYAFSVIDMQLMHGTRAAIPGLAFQDEPGWYIDVGFDKPQSATEDWFKVAGLIGAGR